ncbi:MAG: hypothetical protein ACK5YJ_00345, partial [Curvibacter sp.]
MPATFNVECRLSARNQTTAPETARLSLRRFCCFLILVVSNLLSFAKVLSSRVLTGGMAEERSHQVGEFLQSAQRPQDPLLQLCLGLR